MKFSPFNFQAPLGAGGITLMAFSYLQFAVPHGKGLIKLSDISWASLTTLQTSLYVPLIGIMLIFTIINLLSIIVFSKDLIQWLATKEGYKEFMSGPPSRNTGICVPIASLSMTMNVIFAPLAFFVPQLHANIQGVMLPGLIMFGFLLLMLLKLEFTMLKSWLSQPLDVTKLNFVWLLDVFAFGLVNLTGAGIASMASNRVIASIAAVATLFALSIGSFLLVIKLAYLIYQQLKSSKLPDNQIQPAFFLIVPITCLYAISYYKIMLYLQTWFSFDIEIASFFFVTFSYVIAIGWAIFTVYLLTDYFKNYFYKSEYFPTQWAMV
ncbi:hypothetical protein [Desulfosporosinus sp.]|uniref:selenoprotein TsoY n=1 Tax=Desulfosporosinus sp. TaxID=157907 RepID=UPI0023167614|nr:hypothetical protein [Desulfosporosinus sp.]MDA8221823.1 hypothetical protein [Desulfitobacterium hafniense]